MRRAGPRDQGHQAALGIEPGHRKFAHAPSSSQSRGRAASSAVGRLPFRPAGACPGGSSGRASAASSGSGATARAMIVSNGFCGVQALGARVHGLHVRKPQRARRVGHEPDFLGRGVDEREVPLRMRDRERQSRKARAGAQIRDARARKIAAARRDCRAGAWPPSPHGTRCRSGCRRGSTARSSSSKRSSVLAISASSATPSCRARARSSAAVVACMGCLVRRCRHNTRSPIEERYQGCADRTTHAPWRPGSARAWRLVCARAQAARDVQDGVLQDGVPHDRRAGQRRPAAIQRRQRGAASSTGPATARCWSPCARPGRIRCCRLSGAPPQPRSRQPLGAPGGTLRAAAAQSFHSEWVAYLAEAPERTAPRARRSSLRATGGRRVKSAGPGRGAPGRAGLGARWPAPGLQRDAARRQEHGSVRARHGRLHRPAAGGQRQRRRASGAGVDQRGSRAAGAPCDCRGGR